MYILLHLIHINSQVGQNGADPDGEAEVLGETPGTESTGSLKEEM